VRLFIYLLLVTLITGCGYKPTSYYAKREIAGKIFVESKINIQNSQNSIFIKDRINKMIINEFNGILVDKQSQADTIIFVNLKSAKNKAIATDNDGYTKTYRMSVEIEFKYKKAASKKGYKKILVSSYYDYTVDLDSVITNRKRDEAKEEASTNALMDIFSKIGIRSFQQ